MLIATANKLYSVPTATRSGQKPRLWCDNGGIRAIAEAGATSLMADTDGKIFIWQQAELQGIKETGISERITSLLIVKWNPFTLLIGTEPPRIYRLKAINSAPERIETFDHLRCRKDWFTPWGGPPAVRSMAAGQNGKVYADIHVGSIMRSPDAGKTWEPVNPQLNKDVPQVTTTPAAPERVYANTADAVWVSYDHGCNWHHRPFPDNKSYGRAITVHPSDPDCVLASVSNGPHGDDVQGHLFRSDDAGLHWKHVTAGFPSYTADNINTHLVVFANCGIAWAAVADSLYRSHDRGKTWEKVWHAPAVIELLS